MGWIPVDKNVIYKLSHDEQVAYLSLRCALDDGKNLGFREFSRMQKWGRSKTQKFFKKVGYKPGQKRDTCRDKNGTLCSLIFFNLDDTAGTKTGHLPGQKRDTNINTNTKNTNTKKKIDIGRENFVNLPPSTDGSLPAPPPEGQLNGKPKKKKEVKVYTDDMPEVKLWKHAVEQIQKNFEDKTFTPSVKKRSLEMFTKLLKKHSENDIAQAIFFVTGDNEPNNNGFCWAPQFQSPLKLDNTDKNGVKYIEKWIGAIRFLNK